METTRTWAMAATLLFVGIAGCTDAPVASPQARSAPTAAASPADDGPIRNGIEGIVQTEDLIPLAGANVWLMRLELNATTGDDGRFLFGDIEARDYMVRVDLDGFRPLAKRVIVRQDSVQSVQFLLMALPNQEPFVETNQQAGHISCTVVMQTEPGNQDDRDCSLGVDPNERTVHEFEVKQWAAHILFEADWDPSSEISEDLSLSAGTVGLEPVEATYGRVFGPPGLRILVPQSVVERQFGDGGTVRTHVRAASSLLGGGGFDAGAAAQQPFVVYVTVFYVQPGGSDFSATPTQR